MTFDYPYLLFCFLIFIPIFIFDIIKNKRRQKLSLALERKIRASAFFFRLFLVFAIIALAGPRWGVGYAQTEFRRGLDIVFAIDVSRSMDIRDAKEGLETRLERGLAIAQESLIAVQGARYAAAIGRGRGYLAIPLTHNSEATLVFLEAIDIHSMTGRSTNLEALVDAAASAFESTSPARRVIVLISDGEAHLGVLQNAINRCIREGIIINAVAVGSDEGRQIRAQADNPQSPLVISRREAAVMRSTAERTGGIFIDADRDDAASMLSNHLMSLAQQTVFSPAGQTGEAAGNEYRETELRQRRSLFIIFALIFFAASKFVTRSFKTNILRANSVSFSLLTLHILMLLSTLFLFSSCSEGKLLILHGNFLYSRGRYEEAIMSFSSALNHDYAAPYAEYGLGLIFFTLDEGESALHRFSNSQNLLRMFSGTEHRELRYRNYYNSGIVLFDQGEFQPAADAFKDALRIFPGRIEAKRNLELSLMALAAEADTQETDEARQEQMEILFEYLRYEEEQRWRSREWTPEEEFTEFDF